MYWVRGQALLQLEEPDRVQSPQLPEFSLQAEGGPNLQPFEVQAFLLPLLPLPRLLSLLPHL